MANYIKRNGQYICIPKEEMIKEHEELTGLLGKTAEELEAEKGKQESELEEYKKNAIDKTPKEEMTKKVLDQGLKGWARDLKMAEDDKREKLQKAIEDKIRRLNLDAEMVWKSQ